MSFATPLLVIFSMVWICCAVLISNWRARRSSKLPPGPYRYPIIGNIINLGSQPQRSLAKLSRKYGAVMALKLGSKTTIIVSSPEAARLVMQKNDLAFSSRTVLAAAAALDHDESSIVWLPVGNKWRTLRKICREQLLSAARLDASQGLRREELQKLSEHVSKCCETGRAVDVRELVFTTILNIMSASLFSVELAQFGSDSSQEMQDVVYGIMKCFIAPNIADVFPVLKSADPQGILKQSEFYIGKMFAIFDEILDERLKSSGDKNDFLQALLHLNGRDEPELSKHDIKHLLMDLLLGGVLMSSGTLDWAMMEVIHNPAKMLRLRNEIRKFMEENGQLQESNIPQLPYLQAVVKETFRLHPVAPLLVPRKATTDVEMGSFVIPKNAQVLINAWAIGRDPSSWKNPDEFVPERFLNENHHVDFSGQYFELLPFGSGRRMCPGMPLADRLVHQVLATIVGNFDWKPETTNGMDMTHKFTQQRVESLKAIPKKL